MRIPVSKLLPVSILLLLVSVLLVSGAALAQNATGSIRGAVIDEQGAALPNATVIVTNKATESARKLTTNNDGSYAAENLLPGEYEVRIELQGFISQLGSAARSEKSRCRLTSRTVILSSHRISA